MLSGVKLRVEATAFRKLLNQRVGVEILAVEFFIWHKAPSGSEKEGILILDFQVEEMVSSLLKICSNSS